MREPLVSVCIPAYKQVEFLTKTLESLIIQNYRNLEIVVTDDTPGMEVRNLIKNYEGKLNLVYHKNPDPLGSPANWNKALDLAKGELIKIIHHDDWLSEPDAIRKMVAAMEERPDAGFGFCDSEVLDVGKKMTSTHKPARLFLKKLSAFPESLFCNNQIGSPTATIFRKTPLRFDKKIHYVVDVEFYIRLLREKNSFVYIPQALIVNTRNHETQVTSRSMDAKTQLSEYCYLYDLVFGNKIPSFKIAYFFFRLFRDHKIRSVADLEKIASVPRPRWFFKFLLLTASIKP